MDKVAVGDSSIESDKTAWISSFLQLFDWARAPHPIGELSQSPADVLLTLTAMHREQSNPAQRETFAEPLHQLGEVVYLLHAKHRALQQWVTISSDLIKSVAARESSSVLSVLMRKREEHLVPFDRGSLNAFNSRYYESQSAFDNLPQMFTSHSLIADALAAHFDTTLPNGDLRIKELCAGSGGAQCWKPFFERSNGRRELFMVLSDGAYSDSNLVTHRQGGHVQLRTKAENLLEQPMSLTPHERFDAIVICYGIDSIWFPGDMEVCKVDGDYFERVYRIAVPDWHPSRRRLIDAFAQEDARHLVSDEFKQLVLERMVVPLDLEPSPWLDQLLTHRVGEGDGEVLHVPLGFVHWVQNIFDLQLRVGGRLIVCDVGPHEEGPPLWSGFLESGTSAYARTLDYPIIAALLKWCGFHVKVTPLSEICAKWVRERGAEETPAVVATDLDISSLCQYQVVMEIGRNR